jgi:hypothetical protein
MITVSSSLDQSQLSQLQAIDPLIQRYRRLLALLDWSLVPVRTPDRAWPGPRPHPETAYIKALLVKLCEDKIHITQLRSFLVEHLLLVLELGFLPVWDPSQPYGFDVEHTVPCDRWLRSKQQLLDHELLRDIFRSTVHALQQEIPGLGEVVAFDVKHIYAWVKENNPRVSMHERFCKDHQPTGDPDCRVGVKKSTNQEQPDGSNKERKEYLWGYGSGVAAAITPDYGDVILDEYTLPFNESDVTYFRPLYWSTVATLGYFPTHITADAAYDAWYVYETCVCHHGIAAVPLNQHGHPVYKRDADGVPLCPKGLRMHPTYQFTHTNGYRAQRYRCPLLYPKSAGHTCDHAQFAKGKGCVKDINAEAGGQVRVALNRSGPLYQAVYRQRTSCERINSQAKALGIERPHVRNRRSVANLNTLTYILINLRALARACSINTAILQPSRQ